MIEEQITVNLPAPWSHGRFETEVVGPINYLVGPNGSGKSRFEDVQIVREDTLRSPAFTDSSTGGLATFDCVIANPPFSLKEWGREVWDADPWGRAAFGLPPDNYGDFAWVQHMVASMAAGTGRMAVVLPQGA